MARAASRRHADSEVEDRPIFLPGQFKAGKIGLSPSNYNVGGPWAAR